MSSETAAVNGFVVGDSTTLVRRKCDVDELGVSERGAGEFLLLYEQRDGSAAQCREPKRD